MSDPDDIELRGPGNWRVQLCRASIPGLLGLLADHYWFALLDPATAGWHRWEVWQERDAGGTSWGHLHCDLMRPEENVGGGQRVVEREWRGEEAQRLANVLTDPDGYPHRLRYRAWPGPNSNTYVAWVLRRAGIKHALSRKGIGKNY